MLLHVFWFWSWRSEERFHSFIRCFTSRCFLKFLLGWIIEAHIWTKRGFFDLHCSEWSFVYHLKIIIKFKFNISLLIFIKKFNLKLVKKLKIIFYIIFNFSKKLKTHFIKLKSIIISWCIIWHMLYLMVIMINIFLLKVNVFFKYGI